MTREQKLRTIAAGLGASDADLASAITSGASVEAFSLVQADKAITKREAARHEAEVDQRVKSITAA